MKDRWMFSRNVQRQLRKSTMGWKLKVLWNDSTSTWTPLKDLKDSNPVDLAEFALSKGINKEPDFSWWTLHTLKKGMIPHP